MRINTNDKVMIVNPEGVLARFEGKTGTVERIYPELIPPIAIVKFEEDETVRFDVSVKVPVENLAKVELETEIREGAKMISRDEFKKAIEKVAHLDNIFTGEFSDPMSSFIKGITTMVVGDFVRDAIFKDKDVVYMTEDELVSEIWSACNPVTLSENVKKGMPASKCMHVSITAMIGLETVVEILFGRSND